MKFAKTTLLCITSLLVVAGITILYNDSHDGKQQPSSAEDRSDQVSGTMPTAGNLNLTTTSSSSDPELAPDSGKSFAETRTEMEGESLEEQVLENPAQPGGSGNFRYIDNFQPRLAHSNPPVSEPLENVEQDGLKIQETWTDKDGNKIQILYHYDEAGNIVRITELFNQQIAHEHTALGE